MKKGKNYYGSIISKMGSDIKTTREMYDIISSTNAEFGLELVQQVSTQLNELCKVLGDSISEALDNDTKKRGRQIPKLFVLNLEKAQKSIQNLREEKRGVSKQSKSLKKHEKTEPIKELPVELGTKNVIKFSRQHSSATQDAAIIEDLKYLVVSIIAREGKSVNIAALMKVIRNAGSRYYSITKQDLLNIVESENVLSLSSDKQSICYSDKEVLLGCVEKYHPKNKKYTIHARISMTAHEITNKFGLTVNLISSISENDGIYEIYMDRSFNTFLKLLNLYRSFRGTDMIIGNEIIVEELEVQKSRTDGLFRNNTYLYLLEKPIE